MTTRLDILFESVKIITREIAVLTEIALRCTPDMGYIEGKRRQSWPTLSSKGEKALREILEAIVPKELREEFSEFLKEKGLMDIFKESSLRMSPFGG